MQEPQGTWVWSLGWEGPLEEKMTTHSSILAWRIRIPWTEEPGGLQSMGLQSQIGLKWLSKQLVHFTDVGLFITLLYYPFYIISLFSKSPPLLLILVICIAFFPFLISLAIHLSIVLIFLKDIAFGFFYLSLFVLIYSCSYLLIYLYVVYFAISSFFF